MKSPAVPLSTLIAVTVATAAGADSLERVAVAGAGRRVARRVDRPHRQRAGARRQRHARGRPGRSGSVVASTQVVPSALTWIFSPAPSAPVNVPLTVCDAALVMKSPAVPLSALIAVTVATSRRRRLIQRVAVAGARRRVARRVDRPHRQRAGARGQTSRPRPTTSILMASHQPRSCHLR